MKYLTLLSTTVILSSCASLNDSLVLGGGLGLATGAVATYAGQQSANGKSAKFEDVAVGAGIGLGIGLLTSYFTHKQVEKKRDLSVPETDMHFGDLPPSPFIMPSLNPKKKGK